jgi:hypothetical protein
LTNYALQRELHVKLTEKAEATDPAMVRQPAEVTKVRRLVQAAE